MLDTVQLYAGLVVLRKTPFALRFVREWLAWATEGELITDAWQPARQHAGFQQHRHDQVGEKRQKLALTLTLTLPL